MSHCRQRIDLVHLFRELYQLRIQVSQSSLAIFSVFCTRTVYLDDVLGPPPRICGPQGIECYHSGRAFPQRSDALQNVSPDEHPWDGRIFTVFTLFRANLGEVIFQQDNGIWQG